MIPLGLGVAVGVTGVGVGVTGVGVGVGGTHVGAVPEEPQGSSVGVGVGGFVGVGGMHVGAVLEEPQGSSVGGASNSTVTEALALLSQIFPSRSKTALTVALYVPSEVTVRLVLLFPSFQ